MIEKINNETRRNARHSKMTKEEIAKEQEIQRKNSLRCRMAEDEEEAKAQAFINEHGFQSYMSLYNK